MSRDARFVRRPAGYWTEAVHDVLHHLARHGFPYSPRPMGVEGDSEILTHIDGESGAQGWSKVVTEEGLRSFAGLLASYHDTIKSFVPRADVQWAFGVRPMKSGEIVCHGDFGPWNVVWDGAVPVGLLDWDFVYPGSPMDDVAYALEYSVPFRDDATCLQWLGYSAAPDRRRRIEVFVEAYGLPTTAGLVDEVIRRQRTTIELSEKLRPRGFPTSPDWPSREELEARAQWTEANRRAFEL